MGWKVKIHTIDVSQGDCSLIQIMEMGGAKSVIREIDVLIDGGERDQDEKILEYFQDIGIKKIDLIIITHGDNDHYRGIESLLLKDNYWHYCRTMFYTVIDKIMEILHSEDREVFFSGLKEKGSFEGFEEDFKETLNDFLEKFTKYTASFQRKKERIIDCYIEQLSNDLSSYICPVADDSDIEDLIAQFESLKEEGDEWSFIRNLYWNKVFRLFCVPFYEEPRYMSGYFKNTKIILNGNQYSKTKLNILGGMCWGSALRLKPEEDRTKETEKYLELYGVDREIIRKTPEDIGEDILVGCELVQEDIPAKIVLTAVDRKVDSDAGSLIVNADRNIKNCSSIALVLLFQDYAFYTGGDLPNDGEKAIANKIQNGGYELIPPAFSCFGFKAGHHGSITATTDGILDLQPMYAVISCGDNLSKYDRDFDHPNAKTIESLNKCNSVRIFFSTACAHYIPNFRLKGVITGYTKTKSFMVRGHERLQYVDDIHNHRGTMSCEILSKGESVLSVSMSLYEGSASRCRYKEYSIYDSGEEENTCGAIVPEQSFVLLPGLMEFEEIDWKVENGVSLFETTFSVGQIPLQLLCCYIKMENYYEAVLTVKEQRKMTISDILSWLDQLVPKLHNITALFEKMKLSNLAFTGIIISVDADTKKLRTMRLFGNICLGELEFTLVLAIPDDYVHAELTENQHPVLEPWLEKVGISKESLAFLGESRLTDMGFTADIAVGRYEFSLKLDFDQTGMGLGFEEFGLSMDFGGADDFSVYADAVFLIGKFPARLWGMYDAGKWVLEGDLLNQGNEWELSLSKLPVVGEYLPKGMDVEVTALKFGYEDGFYLEVCVQFGSEEECFRLETEKKERMLRVEKGENTLDMRKRFLFQKQFGPVEMNAFGIALTGGILLLTPELTIRVGSFMVALNELSMGIDLSNKRMIFSLNGMGMSYQAAQFMIAAEFRKTVAEQMAYQYDGIVEVKASQWQFLGIGSYAKTLDGVTSVFLFADASMRIAIQPSFILTDVVGGAGIHRQLRIPDICAIESFPLLSAGKNPLSVLSELDANWLTVNPSEDWLAVGVGFEIAGLFQGKAVLLASLGEMLEFDVLGLGSLDLPKGGDQKYLHLGLELEARLQPKEGAFFAWISLGSDSYLMCRDCHIVGELAFYIWFGSQTHKGDFVIAAGGYHPAFSVPAHYPKMESVEISWQISSNVSLSGNTYFALTPSCAMVGGNLAINYADGNLKAWFYAFANLLVAWKPFHFLADIGVELGISYRMNLLFCHKTILTSVGGNLHLWGPPTGGKVTVHLWFISFSVKFGEDESNDTNTKPLDWEEFCGLLPDSDILSVEPIDGVIEKKDSIWTVRGNKFRFAVNSCIPSSQVIIGNCLAENNNTGIHIRPMNLSDVDSKLKIRIVHMDAEGEAHADQHFVMSQNRESMPAALWGCPQSQNGHFIQNGTRPTAELIENLIQGAEFAVRESECDAKLYIPDLESISVLDSMGGSAVSLTLMDYRLPRLKTGRYRISLEQELSYENTVLGEIPAKTQEIIVDSYQTRLPEQFIAGCSPFAGSCGDCKNVIPHIILADSILPWEQQYGVDEKTPWMTLMVFAEGELLESGKENVICISKKLYQSLLPSEEELRLLCHSRHIDVTGEDYAVVMANRFPQDGQNIAHLVSLKGIEELESESGEKMVEINSLYSFQFCCCQSHTEDFYHSAVKLKRANPKRIAFGSDCDENGYVKLKYHQNLGRQQERYAIYRGPLIAQESTDTTDSWILETAKQIGRMMALADTAYLHALMSYRQKGTQPLQFENPLETAGKKLAQIAEKFMHPTDRNVWKEKCIGIYQTQKEEQPSEDERKRPEERPFYNKEAWTRAVAQEMEVMDGWLSGFIMLNNLPFGYLIPVKELLPSESVRFFRLDKEWLKYALGGAIEIGETCSRQKALTQLLKKKWEKRIEASNVQGVIIRSALLTHWSSATIHLFDADDVELEVLRKSMLSSDICLLLCEGNVLSVKIREPAEGVRMQVNEDMSVCPRFPDGLQPCRNTCQNGKDWIWYRDEMLKILNISGDKGLAEMFRSAVNTEMTPSRFALQFIEGARSIWIRAD